MYKLSENCTRGEKVAFGGKGTIQFKMLGVPEEMYKSASLFNHVVIQPGCSIGYHTHETDTELYYITKGSLAYNDNGVKTTVSAGDVTVCPPGEGHSITNMSDEDCEFVALILYV